jgi:LysR family transcriptional regulator, carnitine catabolism transcriptional activator
MSARYASSTRSLNLSLKHLRAVREVAELASFTAAADKLAMTQPGVSRLVAQVERDLGLALFERSTRNVVLTPAGREFAHSVGGFLDELDDHIESVRAHGRELRGRVVISSLQSLTQHLVPSVMLDYRRENPAVEVHVREGLGAEVYEDVRSGLADFGIGNAVGLSEDLVGEGVFKEACLAVLPAAHPLVTHRAVRLADLAGHPFVSLPHASGLRRLIDGTAAMEGVSLNHMVVVEQFRSLFDFIAAGLGVGIVPPSALPPRLRTSLRVRPIAPPGIVRQIGILRRRDRGLTPAAAAFLQTLRPPFARAGRRPRRSLAH